MKTKIQELKAKAVSLRTQKTQLKAKLTEVQTQAAHLMQKLASLQDAAEEASAKADLRVAALTDQLKQQQEQRRPDHDAEEVELRPQQPDANATSLIPHDDDDDGGVPSNGNINDQGADSHDQSTAGEGEIKKINAPADTGDDHGQTTTTTTTNGTDTGTGTGTGAGTDTGGGGGGGGGGQGGGEYSEKQEEQGSEGGKWVRLETNVDDGAQDSAGNGDGRSVGGEDRGKEAGEHQVGELVAPEGEQGREVLKEEGAILSRQVGDQSGVPGDGGQASQATTGATDQLRLDNSITSSGATTTGAEDVAVAIRGDVVESSNTTEIITTSSSVTAASTEEEGNKKLEREDNDHNNGEGSHEEKQTTAETQISIRGKRSRRTTRSKGRRRKEAAAARSSEQPNSEVLLKSSSSISSRQEISFQHGDADGDGGQSSGGGGHEIINAADGRPVLDDKNAAAETANSVLLWPKVQGRQVQTDAADAAAEEQSRGTTVGGGLELASVSSTADTGDDKVGIDGGEREKISSGTTEGSNTSEGAAAHALPL